MNAIVSSKVNPLLLQRFSRAAKTYAANDFLAREIATRLFEHLDFLRVTPKNIVDIGCGTTRDLPSLQARFPEANVIGLDASLAMLKSEKSSENALKIQGNFYQLPFAARSLDLIWSNLSLARGVNIPEVIKEAQRALCVDGLFIFASLGPDTLLELRDSFNQPQKSAFPEFTHVDQFMDMHDYGDALIEAGFTEPVIDVERITLNYQDLNQLFADLKNVGGACISPHRNKGFTGKESWEAMKKSYESKKINDVYPATIEVVFGHAWRAERKKNSDGNSIIRFR